MDVRGSLPLSCVQEKDYDKWIQFLQLHEDELWPCRVNSPKRIPPLTLECPNSRPIPEPRIMLPTVFVGMLASGRMLPEEIITFHDFDESSDDDSEASDSDDSSDSSDDDDETKLEYLDPDNRSIGKESNPESGRDNIDRVVTDVHDINVNIKTLIDNIIMFRSEATCDSCNNDPLQ
jgi:hypothetical protein